MRYRKKRLAGAGHAQMSSATPHWGRRLRLITCTLVVLVVGVAGAASAAALIGSKQVKDGSLTGHDLKLGTVRGTDVRNHSLKPKDFDIVPQGPAGPQGDPGDRGEQGLLGLEVRSLTRSIPANSTPPAMEILCAVGQKAIFGGADLPSQMDMLQSAPAGDGSGSGWGFLIRNRSSVPQTVTAQAFCVTDR
jgi:hypothetical protein